MSTTPPNRPDSNSNRNSNTPEKRNLLIEQLEERVLFDAVPVAPVDMNFDQAFDAGAFVQAANQQQQPVDGAAADGQQQTAREVLFVDKGVENYQDIIAGFVQGRDIDVFLINSGSDGLEQIARHLEGRTDLAAIHIVSHGDDAQLHLGDTTIRTADLSGKYSATLARIGGALSADGDILVYGCQLAGSVEGEAFVRELSGLTGADVAASDDLTGTDSLGGDWELEHQSGTIDVKSLSAAGFGGVLLTSDNGFTVGTATFAGMNETAVVPVGQTGTSSRTYNNAATANGGTITINLRLTLVDTFDASGNVTTGGPNQLPVTFSNFAGGPILLARNVGTSVSGYMGHTAHVLVEFFNAANGNALSVVGDFTFKDIDYEAPAATGAGSEAVTAVSDQMSAYQISSSPVSNISVVDNGNGTTTFTNTVSNGGEADQQRWVSIRFHDMPQLNLRFTARNANTGYGMSTANFSAAPLSYSQPVATNDNFSTNENGTLSGNVITGNNGNGPDSDPDNDPLNVYLVNGQAANVGTSVAGSGGGLFQINANGSYSFNTNGAFDSLAVGQSAVSTITYTVKDYTGLASQATVTVTVVGTNDAPIATTIPNRTNQDAQTVSLNLSSYFSDVDNGDTLSFSATGLPPGLAMNSAGLITGQIANNASVTGPFSVTVTANDGNGGTVQQIFTWSVTNPAPTATANTAAVKEDTIPTDSGNVLLDNDGNGVDSDPDMDTLSVSAVNGNPANVNANLNGSYGTVRINSDGSYTYTLNNLNPTVNALANGQSLTEIFTYTVTDNQGGTSTANLTITIDGTNDAPQATGSIPNQSDNDNDTITTVNVSGAFNDAEGESLLYTATGLPTGLTLDLNSGLITGTIDNSASQGGTGGVYTVTVTATDGQSTSATSTFTWTVANPGPVAGNDFGSTDEETASSGTVFGNDSDPDGDTIVVSTVSGSAAGVGNPVAGSSGGSFTILNNGSYSFDPNGAFDSLAVGETATTNVSYTITDNEGGNATATLQITVTGVNDDPTATGTIPNQNGNDAQTISTLDVSSYFADADTNDTLLFSASGLPAGLSIDSAGNITGTIDNSASVVGTFTVTVTADDQNGGTVDQVFTWTVTNPGPTATDNQGSVVAGSQNTDSGNVITDDDGMGVDSDPDNDALTVVAVEGLAAGVNTTTAGLYGDIQVNSDGTYTYTLDTSNPTVTSLGNTDTLTDSFTYTISDNEGGTSQANVTITITGENDAPVVGGTIPAQSDLDADTITAVDASTVFSDPDGDTLDYSAFGLPPGLSIDMFSGLITGTLDNDASLGGPYIVTITAVDNNGGSVSTTFNWTVGNPAPTASDNSGSVTDGSQPIETGNVISDDDGNGIDSDPDNDVLTVSEVQGSAANVGTPFVGLYGDLQINSNGSYTFTLDETNPDVEALDSGEFLTETFTYKVTDSQGGESVASLTITINGTNDAPVVSGTIANQSNEDADTIATVDVTSAFSDLDGEALLYSTSGLPAGLSIDLNSGLITGTIDNSASLIGTYTVTVTATDGDASVSTVFNWTVTNPGPVAADDSGSTTQGTTTSGTVTGNDVDPDGDTITVSAVNSNSGDVANAVAGSTGGFFTVFANGSYNFDPNGDFDYLALNETATTTVAYTIDDGEGGTDSALLTVTITGTNDAPYVNASIPPQLNQDAEAVSGFDVSGYFADIDTLDMLTFSAAGLPTGLSIDAAGNITGTIDNSASQSGPFIVTITANDNNGGTVSQSFTWTVTNPGPVAGNDTGLTDEATVVSGSVFGNDSDPDGDTIVVVAVDGDTSFAGNSFAGSNGGLFTIKADGSYDFDPNGEFEGLAENESATTSISYQISDNEGGFATATLQITIDGLNDAPTVAGVIPNQNSQDANTIAGLDVSSYFADADASDSLSFSVTGLPAGLSMDSAGTITGTIANNASVAGTYAVTVTVDDGFGGTTQQTFNWTVTNPAPTAVNNTASVTEGSALTDSGNLILDDDGSGADSDPDGDVLTVVEVNGSVAGVDNSTVGMYGSIFIGADGSYTYTLDDSNPDVNALDNSETLIETFTYKISDNQGGESTATLTITINGANDAPVVGGTIAPQSDLDSDTVATVDASLAFSDPDGDTLTYAAANLPAGLLIDMNTGLITGTLDNSASQGAAGGVYNVTVTATDDNGLSVSTTFDWTVSNPGPTAGNDTFTTDEDTPVAGSVAGNDSDSDGDALTFTIGTGATNGNVSMAADGSFTYTPDPDFNGTDSVTYTLTDADGATTTATVNITIDPINDDPTLDLALADQANVDSETIFIDISSNFSDIEGDSLTFAATGLPPGLTMDSAGNITGTLDSSASQGGPYTVLVSVDDGNGGSVADSFDWTITNPAPVAGDDNYTTPEDTTVSGTVATNDNDVDGDALSYMISSGPANGLVTLNNDGTFDYTPDSDFFGTDTFDYEVTDADGAVMSATVTIVVTPVNDDPVNDSPVPNQSNADSDIVNLDLSGTFSDIEGETLSFSATGLPPGLTMDSAGNIAGTIGSSASQTGSFTVTVTVVDGNGGSVVETFNWSVTNPAPIAGDDSFNTNEDVAFNGSVTSNDSDPDGDTVSFNQLTSPANGTLIFNNDGSFTYTPDADFFGTDSFDYEIVDADGQATAATVTVNIASINDAPVLNSGIPNQSSTDSQNISLDVAPNFSDVEGDTLIFTASGLPAGLSMDAAGNISGTIDSSASVGGPYTVTVTVDDGNVTTTTTFEWTVLNPAPDAVNDSFNTDEDTPVSGDAGANDSDPDGDLTTFNKLTDPSNGTVVFLSDGTFTYTPDLNFSGIDSFDYEIIDADSTSAQATVTLVVGDVNDPPVVTTPIPNRTDFDSDVVNVDVSGNFGDAENEALTFTATGLPPGLTIDLNSGIISGTIDSSASQAGTYTVVVTATDGAAQTVTDSFAWTINNVAPVAADDGFTTDEDTAISGSVAGNDSDPDNDILTFSNPTLPARGSVTMAADGSFTYTPDVDFHGIDSFDYTVTDADGLTTTASVTIVVNPVNDDPFVAAPLANQSNVDSDSGISIDVSGSFDDIDGDTLTFSANGLPPGLSIDINTGLITGTLTSGASASGPFSVEIIATDPGGRTATQFFNWSVSNPGPVAGDDSFTTDEDTTVNGAVTGNDSDPDGDTVTYILSAGPMNGSASVNPDGTFSYTPDPDFSGTDSFEYEVTDADGATTTATVTITVTPVNDAPTVTSPLADQSNFDTENVSLDASTVFDDIDSTGLTFTATGLPPGLSIEPTTGLITGTLTPGASSGGPYTVTIVARDPNGLTATDSFTWNVDNIAPIAVDDTFSTDEDTPFSGSVAGNDSDPDGDAVTFSLLPGGPSHGMISFNPDGSFNYIPDANFNGTDQFDYVICDADGLCTTAVATINVNAVNDPPVVTSPIADRTDTDSDNINLDVSGSFADTELDDLNFTATGLPPGVSIDPASGVITGTIDSGASNGGPYVVAITATDIGGGSATDTFTWTVENAPPVAVNDGFSTIEDSPVSGNVSTNDHDPDGDSLNFNVFSGPSSGTVSLNPDGTFTYTPNADFNGSDSFIYTATDADGASANAFVTINVTPVNDGPTAFDDAESTDEDTPIRIDLTDNDFDPESDTLTIIEINGQPLSPGGSITLASGAVVSINGDGTIDYNPAGAFDSLKVGQSAIDSFEYTVSDGNGGTATAETVVTINGENDPPVAGDDYVKVTVDTPVTVNVLGNDYDPEGEPLDVILLNTPAGGTATVNPDGTITFVPDGGFEGTVDIHYLIEDPNGATSEATLTIEVEPEFRFDSFTNFSKSFNSGRFGVDNHDAPGHRILSQQIFSLAPEPIFSGHARPGTQIVGRIYDESGALIGEAMSNTDPGGNWMMQFHGTTGNNFYRIEFEQVSAGASDVYGYFGLDPADNTYQAMESMTSYEDPLSVEKAMKSSLDSIQQIHRVNENPLGFGSRDSD